MLREYTPWDQQHDTEREDWAIAIALHIEDTAQFVNEDASEEEED